MGDYIDKIARRGEKDGGPDAVVVVSEGSGYGKVKQRALDDLAAVLKVPKESREDFDGALTDLIDCCMKDTGTKSKADDAEESEAPADTEE